MCVCVCVSRLSYVAVGLYVRSLQGDGDAVEEDEDQDHVVKQLVRDETLAPVPEPERAATRSSVNPPRRCAQKLSVNVCARVMRASYWLSGEKRYMVQSSCSLHQRGFRLRSSFLIQ